MKILLKIKNLIKTITLPLLVVCINLLIIFFPKECILGAKEGLDLWFNNVLPSLLPFIIGTNLLSHLGVVDFIGVLLEPIVRPIFGIPGKGVFALASGLLSGYPIGAKVVSELYEKNEITKTEANRLITFTNNSGPLFILGTVSIGMFSNKSIGYFLIFVHIISSLSTGLVFKNYNRKENDITHFDSEQKLINKAYLSMKEKRYKNNFGAILGDSVVKSVETILSVGGFIILFSVLTKALEITNILNFVESLLIPLGDKFKIPHEVYKGTIAGIIEMTNGLNILSQNELNKSILIACSAILSWGGLSIHAQSINFISKTDINISMYILGKFINTIFAIIYSSILYVLFEEKIIFEQITAVAKIYDMTFYKILLNSTKYVLLGILLLICIGILGTIIKKYQKSK